MEKSKPEIAAQGALFKEIPLTRATIAVTAVSGTASLATYAGKWIWLRAITADVTCLRGSQTVVAGQGMVFVSTAGTPHADFYVDPDGNLTLSHISTTNATLEVLY